MRLALVIAIWKRHDLERIVLDNFKSQSEKFGFEIIVAGSEGETSKELATGLHYIEVLNYPVSNKHNALLSKAKELKVDGVVLMGSDDIVNDGFWKHIYSLSPNEKEVVGFKDIYFYDNFDKKLGYWKGYESRNQTIGAGRFFSKEVLDKMGWKLWDKHLNSGLDSNCSLRLKSKLIKEKSIKMSDVGAFIVDIKHTRNITKSSILLNCELVNTSIMAKKVGAKATKEVNELSNEAVKVTIDESKFYNITGTGKGALVNGKVYNAVNGKNVAMFVQRGFAIVNEEA